MRNIISTVLFGALTFGTASLAVADHDHDRYGQRHRDRDNDNDNDDQRVLDTHQLRRTSGRIEFDLTPGLRRDGLMLVTDGRVAVRKVQFVYDDGNVVTMGSRQLARLPQDRGALTIQTGRPPGLRHVRVWYRLSARARSAELQLVSFGDGYTDKEDIRDYERRYGD